MTEFDINFATDERILVSEEPFRYLMILASSKEPGADLEYLLATDFSKDEDGTYRIYSLVAEGGEVRNPRDEERWIIDDMMKAVKKTGPKPEKKQKCWWKEMKKAGIQRYRKFLGSVLKMIIRKASSLQI